MSARPRIARTTLPGSSRHHFTPPRASWRTAARLHCLARGLCHAGRGCGLGRGRCANPGTPTILPERRYGTACSDGQQRLATARAGTCRNLTGTGSRLGLTLLETPASVEVLSGETIRERGDQSVREAVTRTTGITSNGAPGNGGIVAHGARLLRTRLGDAAVRRHTALPSPPAP
ncbi:TonB-dependent receptor plug domain-containing protein [Cupriavidus basilensis]